MYCESWASMPRDESGGEFIINEIFVDGLAQRLLANLVDLPHGAGYAVAPRTGAFFDLYFRYRSQSSEITSNAPTSHASSLRMDTMDTTQCQSISSLSTAHWAIDPAAMERFVLHAKSLYSLPVVAAEVLELTASPQKSIT